MDKNILFHMRNKHVYLQKHNKHDKNIQMVYTGISMVWFNNYKN